MTGKDILTAFGGIDESLIEDGEKRKNTKKAVIIKFCAAAACLAVTAVGVFAALKGNAGVFGRNTETENTAGTDDVKESASNADDGTYAEMIGGDYYAENSEDYTTAMPSWEERSIASKFSEIKLGSCEYSVWNKKADNDDIGSFIEKTVITGRDYLTEKEYTQNAELYELRGIAREAAIAVKYDGDGDFYICRSHNYRPATLGLFINALGLEKNLEFKEVCADIRKCDKVTKRIEYTGWNAKKITELLLECKAARAADEEEVPWFSADIEIDASLNAVGQTGVYIAISRDGYLETNILDTAKLFFIGKSAAERIIGYFEKNCASKTLQTYSVSDDGGNTDEAFTGSAAASGAVTSAYIP